ncbi:Shedu anti-phage system protein SduA domain-containing protein [Chryseobacterium sp. C3]|uniref:Shedu anti-phage system protein SduA domain-containing protein n=1 Tax=Chryseobacterium sp. C3 TaxID=2761532 RepID=UPI0016236A37|nr:Shedu anti-phage system protein SduA domain-containing protein [Chryseobacterium sp. C3]
MEKKFLKSPKQKLATKINKIKKDSNVKIKRNEFYVDDILLLKVLKDKLIYYSFRYKPNNIEKVSEVKNLDSIKILIDHDTLDILNVNILNPPNNINKIYNVFKDIEGLTIRNITIGDYNKIDGNDLYINLDTYHIIVKIDNEENIEKSQKVFNRLVPFLKSDFNLLTNSLVSNRDYSLLLKEIIASGEINQEDLINLSNKLAVGNSNQVVIEKQINRQTKWLIDTIEDILEEDNITVPKAKDIGNTKFGFLKTSIIGAENLMERILTEYGQYCLFGVPALLNTNKYVIKSGRSRSQFDIILINHLGDIEVVELKRPDKYLLKYGGGRGKFYPSEDLAIAIAQTERYITNFHKDNDPQYKIDGKSLNDFLNDKIGNTLHIETIRPKGLIIMGSWKKLCPDYESLDTKLQNKLKKQDYINDSMQAYKELTNSLKNITILTYSELLENARTRLELDSEI